MDRRGHSSSIKLQSFCKICFSTSHNTVSCNALSTSHRRDMLVALHAMNLSDDFVAIEEGEDGLPGDNMDQEYAQGLQDHS